MRQGLFEKFDKIPFDMLVNCVFYWDPMSLKNYICQENFASTSRIIINGLNLKLIWICLLWRCRYIHEILIMLYYNLLY